ncbi:filaggrin-like isoform X2 [Ornithodoros turicata]|uniref:filaggrin-like isoform X2 n=1 Tax=Ornithodoros turicata TaxID=34597 RepID=UPI00313877CA
MEGFQELSKEEKEEMVERRMDDMRRKNEELLKRYAEIEADKKNADLFSSSAIKDSPKKVVPAHEVQANASERKRVLRPPEQPKPLRRPHTTLTEKPPQNKIQPEERRMQRLSADDHPPPDPGFRFLADRMREQGEDEGANGQRTGDWGEQRGHSQRHRRNYGGKDFENVGPTMRHQRDLEREYPESPPRNLAMRMTGRQRREYEQWKCDRERIDQERLQRHTTASGEFKREWDHHKEEQEDLPPQSGRKYEDQGHSYGSRVFSRGGRRGRGNGLSRGPRRGGRQETMRDRTESSSSARSDLSSESEFFRDRPRNIRHPVPAHEHEANLPGPNVEGGPHLGSEQPTILRNYHQGGEGIHRHYPSTGDYEQSNYDQRNYNRGSEQRNYNPLCDGRNHDRNADFDRRGRGRGRGGWEQRGRPRERRGRDWGGRGGRDFHDKMGGGSRPRRRERRGGERSFADRRETAMRIPSSAIDSDGAAISTEDVPRMNTSVEEGGQDGRGERSGGKRKVAEKEGETAWSGTAEDVKSRDACYEAWDAIGQDAGGVEWGVEEGKGDEREEEEGVKGWGGGDSHDEAWEDAPSHLCNDDDNAVEIDKDEAFSGTTNDLLGQTEDTELVADVRESAQTAEHEEVGSESDVEDRETRGSSEGGSREKELDGHAEDQDGAKDRALDAVKVDEVEREQKDLDSGAGSSRGEEDSGAVSPTGNSSATGDELESPLTNEKESFPTDKVEALTSLTDTHFSDAATLEVTNDDSVSTEPPEEAPKAEEDVNQIDHKDPPQGGGTADLKPLSPQTSRQSPTISDTDTLLNHDTAPKDGTQGKENAPEEKQVILKSTPEDNENNLTDTATATATTTTVSTEQE